MSDDYGATEAENVNVDYQACSAMIKKNFCHDGANNLLTLSLAIFAGIGNTVSRDTVSPVI